VWDVKRGIALGLVFAACTSAMSWVMKVVNVVQSPPVPGRGHEYW